MVPLKAGSLSREGSSVLVICLKIVGSNKSHSEGPCHSFNYLGEMVNASLISDKSLCQAFICSFFTSVWGDGTLNLLFYYIIVFEVF